MKLTDKNRALRIEMISEQERMSYFTNPTSIGFRDLPDSLKQWYGMMMKNKQNHITYYVTPNYVKNASLIKMKDVLHNWFDQLPDENGAFVIQDKMCIRYDISSGKDISVVIFNWETKNGRVDMIPFSFPLMNSETTIEDPSVQEKNDDNIEEVLELQQLFYKLLIFKHYALVRLAPMKPNQKIKLNPKINAGESIKNECPINITFMDSLWDKTIIVAGDFKVSGHLRMQPYGPRENPTYYELIWIDQYNKHSYVRRAGKILDDEKRDRAKEGSNQL